MWAVLAGGALAFVTKWVLDGGIKRRDLHLIRDELELAQTVGDEERAVALRDRALSRLDRYLSPTVWQRIEHRRRPVKIMWALTAFSLVGALSVAWQLLYDTGGLPGSERIARGLVAGFLIGSGLTLVTATIRLTVARPSWKEGPRAPEPPPAR